MEAPYHPDLATVRGKSNLACTQALLSKTFVFHRGRFREGQLAGYFVS